MAINSAIIMKKKLALITVILGLYAVNSTASEKSALRKYYETVHHANVLISTGNFDNANRVFDEGLKLIKYPYFIDINNAIYAQVNSTSPDTSKIISYLKMLQLKGFCVHERFQGKEKFVPYLRYVDEDHCHRAIDSNARKIVLRAIKLDQDSRKDPRGIEHDAVQAVMRRVDSINFRTIQYILQLAEGKNIPVESLVGFDCSKYMFAMIQHNASWGRFDRTQLESLVIKGILDARSTALDFDYFYRIGYIKKQKNICEQYGWYGNSILTLIFNPPNSPAFINLLTKECYIEVSQNRERLYLPDVVEEAKIRVYAFYNSKQGFLYDINMLSMSSIDDIDEMEQELRSQSRLIKYSGSGDFDFNRKY
jgi:hypothetical protein